MTYTVILSHFCTLYSDISTTAATFLKCHFVCSPRLAHTLCVLPISFVVHWNYIHGDVILLMWIQTRNLHTHSREHPPATKTKHSIGDFSLLIIIITNKKGDEEVVVNQFHFLL